MSKQLRELMHYYKPHSMRMCKPRISIQGLLNTSAIISRCHDDRLPNRLETNAKLACIRLYLSFLHTCVHTCIYDDVTCCLNCSGLVSCRRQQSVSRGRRVLQCIQVASLPVQGGFPRQRKGVLG